MSDIEFDGEKSVALDRRVDVKLVKERPSNAEGFASANSGRDVESFPTSVQPFRSLNSQKDK
jgi:hypothetical protein